MDALTDAHPLWTPGPERVAAAHLTHFARGVRAAHPDRAIGDDYESLWRWSVDHPEEFWPAVWHYCGVIAEPRDGDPWDEVVHGLERMAPPDPGTGPRWFAGARLNYAENLLRHRDGREAIVTWDERGRRRTWSYAELYAAVARAAAALRADGVGMGDRVAGFLPNGAEAVIAMLATASIGAVWSSCSPDFGATGVLDRFGQIEPVVLFATDGYRFNNQAIDTLERVRAVAARLPSLRRVVMVPTLREEKALEEAMSGGDDRFASWSRYVVPDSHLPTPDLQFERTSFDHPLFIMYSSGTTGLPKGIVHGAGGTLLQHLKELVLHTDLQRNDRVMYFTTCGWMMWNWVTASLAVGATLVCYDGTPLPRRRPGALWDIVQAERLTVFGTSAKWIALTEKAGIEPRETHDLSALRCILSTGSPLAPAGFDYVYRDVKPDVHLASISGGTDIISCFALGVPTLPVWRGELQARGLGMRVEVWDADGRAVVGKAGELVCTTPFPSMPVAFWNDPDGSRYRAAYFEHLPGVWRHGDWAELTPQGGMVIHGRSDATLNPAGVRIGTAEIYRQVEQLPEVVESVAVGQATGFGDVRVVLFVRLRDGVSLDNPLRDRIRDRIREFASPHHVPKKVIQVADIPRTISGKISEIAVRETIHGRAVGNVDALANPESLALYRDLPALRDGA